MPSELPRLDLPPAARAIASATTDAVAAAAIADVAAFGEATGRLAAADPEQVRVVLGVLVRALLEDLHPDGVSGDDLLELIKNCARTAIGWYPGVDVQVLVVVLTGALGVHEPDEEPRQVTALDVARHAPLFIAELLRTPAAAPPGPRTAPHEPGAAAAPPLRPLAHYFAAAFLEISRAELNELP
jgi:hypothetical protein